MSELRWQVCKACEEMKSCDDYAYKQGHSNTLKTTETIKRICYVCEELRDKGKVTHTKTCIHCKEVKPYYDFAGKKKKGSECIACLASSKKCEGCGQERRMTEFYRTYAKGYNGRFNRCKQCQNRQSQILNECKSYVESLYHYLTDNLTAGDTSFVYAEDAVTDAYNSSLWWIENKPQTILNQYFKGKDVLLPIMHLLDDFGQKTKLCSKCKQKLLTGEFSKNHRFASGLHNYCKKCVKSYSKSKKTT